MKAPMRILGTAIFVAVAVPSAACGDDNENEPSDADTASASPTEEPFSGGSTEPAEGAGVPTGVTALLVDVRTGRHVDFDRITFAFEDARPGYRVEYVEPPIVADASGEEVDIEGGAFIRVRMAPAAGYHPDTGVVTYDGDAELKPSLPALVEAERTGDFEALLTWVMGVSEVSEFRVYALDGPPRLVIDIEQPQGRG